MNISSRVLIRALRAGELNTILWSLCLSVAVVAAVSIFAERIERAIINESKDLLGSDYVVRSSKAIPPQWTDVANEMGLDASRTASFASVVFREERMHLAYIKAVQPNYPLRGNILVSQIPFTVDYSQIQEIKFGPKIGEVWVDSRLLPILDVNIGSQIEIGDAEFEISNILIEEPEGSSFSILGSKILMNFSDIDSTKIVQPGSRVTYNLLVSSDNETTVSNYINWVSKEIGPHDRLISPEEAQENVSSTIERGRIFLLLAGSIGVVLASVALALASYLFAEKQKTQVALLKTWGMNEIQVRELYLNQSFLLGFMGSILGIGSGFLFHLILIEIAREWLPLFLPAPTYKSFLIALVTGLTCVLGFVLPALWHLPKQAPISILKGNIENYSLNSRLRILVGLLVITFLLTFYSENISITIAMITGISLISLLSALTGGLLFKGASLLGSLFGGIWRIGLSNLWRRRRQNLIQLIGFSTAIFLFLVLAITRNSLLDEWKLQIDDELPNHFLINVSKDQVKGIENLIKDENIISAGWYSMTRGRITEINRKIITNDQKESHESFNRELNLSWSAAIPEGNKISKGLWWESDWQSGDFQPKGGKEVISPVSVEHDLAKELGLKLGDTITFSIGGLVFYSEVVNTRILDWNKMTPNFYFLFPEGTLQDYPKTSMTSMFIPTDKKVLISEILQAYPTIQIIELDKIFDRVKKTISQITKALEAMTILILFCGILVLIASVHLSVNDRKREAAVLRTFGCNRNKIILVQLIEFVILGLVSGFLGAFGAEAVITLLSLTVFEFSLTLHPWIWFFGPLAGMSVISIFGIYACRDALSSPPLTTLRSYQ